MSQEKCVCPINLPSTFPNIQKESFPNLEVNKIHEVLDFGKVEIGKKVFRKFQLTNNFQHNVTYQITRDPRTNPIYKAFEYNITRSVVKCSDDLQVNINYFPKIPNEVHVDYLQITDSLKNVYVVKLRGESKGFDLRISATRLYFYRKPYYTETKQVIELKNEADAKTYYSLEQNENDPSFKIDKPSGILQAHGHVFISFKFIETKLGCYYRYLYCLNSYFQPLTIELIGIVSDDENFSYDKLNLIAFGYSPLECKGYTGYLYDASQLLNILPPFTLGKTYFDFGRVVVECDSFKTRTITTSLTNQLASAIEVSFDNPCDIFQVTPKAFVVESLSHAIIEVKFTPNEKERFYTGMLMGVINWKEEGCINNDANLININLPMFTSLKVLGHTFPENNIWIPQIEIEPNIVTLPISSLNCPAYTTFLLKNHGYLPVAFKFEPPRQTNFLLKPMLGIVRDFQIIIVQLQTKNIDKQQYVECWSLQCNGSKDHCIPFYLKGYAEIPTINVGIFNNVKFGTIQYGCEEVLRVQMKNTSGHFVEYNFCIDEHEYLSINHPQGHIASNEYATLEWSFKATCKSPTFSTLRCELRPIYQMKSIRGEPVNHFINIYANTAYSELCAIPTEWTIPELLFNKTEVTKFVIYNFGESSIHFCLNITNDAASSITIMPKEGSLSNRGFMEILVHINSQTLGKHTHDIYYEIRKSNHSKEICGKDKKKLFNISFLCVAPYIQICDIFDYNFGPLFNKVMLWEMLNIDQINNALREIEPHTTREVYMSVPDSERSCELIAFKLKLKNVCNFDTTIAIKRKKICDCELVEMNQGISIRVNRYMCSHRALVTIDYPGEALEANRFENMTIRLNYILKGEHVLCYALRFPFGRILELYIKLCVLTIPTEIISVYDPNYFMHFKKCFLGAIVSDFKGFRLYNNTKTRVAYAADLNNLRVFNSLNNFNIIQCTQTAGILEAFSYTILLFKFTPIEAKVYEVNIPLILGAKISNLNIKGEGSMEYSQDSSDNASAVFDNNINASDDTVILSKEHIDLEPMFTHSTSCQMVFIKNLSKDKVFGYSFKKYGVDGFLDLKLAAHKGTLKPKQSNALIIEIQSFDKPCELKIQFPCKLLDHNQYIKRKKSEAEYYLKQQELQGQFTITEHGITYPTNNVVLAPKPNFFYKVLSLNIRIISFFNREIYMSNDAILHQTPPKILHLNTKNVSNFDKVPCHKMNLPDDTVSNRDDLYECKYGTKKDASKKDFFVIFREIINYCIGDVIFSNQFQDAVERVIKNPSPYYYQFKILEEDETMSNRRRLCRRLATNVNPPVIACILKELLTDSFYGIFQLGPQGNNKTQSVIKYDVTVPKCTHIK